jgi:hypothetical protein
MEVKADRGEQHLILHEGRTKPQVSNTGVYDSNLLCGTCDGILGRYEGYVFSLLRRLRTIRADLGSIVDMGTVNGDIMLRFAALEIHCDATPVRAHQYRALRLGATGCGARQRADPLDARYCVNPSRRT